MVSKGVVVQENIVKNFDSLVYIRRRRSYLSRQRLGLARSSSSTKVKAVVQCSPELSGRLLVHVGL